jgi:hypothetical protein
MAEISEYRSNIEIILSGGELENLSLGHVVTVVYGMQAIFIKVRE